MNHVLVRLTDGCDIVYYLYGDEEIEIHDNVFKDMRSQGLLNYMGYQNEEHLYEFTGEPFYWV